MTEIEKQAEQLNDAITNVARCAQDLVDNLEDKNNRGFYLAHTDDVDDLKKALKEWTTATNNFLAGLVPKV